MMSCSLCTLHECLQARDRVVRSPTYCDARIREFDASWIDGGVNGFFRESIVRDKYTRPSWPNAVAGAGSVGSSAGTVDPALHGRDRPFLGRRDSFLQRASFRSRSVVGNATADGIRPRSAETSERACEKSENIGSTETTNVSVAGGVAEVLSHWECRQRRRGDRRARRLRFICRTKPCRFVFRYLRPGSRSQCLAFPNHRSGALAGRFPRRRTRSTAVTAWRSGRSIRSKSQSCPVRATARQTGLTPRTNGVSKSTTLNPVSNSSAVRREFR